MQVFVEVVVGVVLVTVVVTVQPLDVVDVYH